MYIVSMVFNIPEPYFFRLSVSLFIWIHYKETILAKKKLVGFCVNDSSHAIVSALIFT